MTHQVELSDEVYQKIRQAAEKQGITPAEWIATTVSRVGAPISANDEHPADERPLREALQGLVGSFDSSGTA